MISTEYTKLFPMLKNHPEIAYLDSASTALTPNAVIKAMQNYYECYNTNISRGVDKIAYELTMMYENVRTQVKEFIHAQYTDEVIFTRGTTESLNLVATGFAQPLLQTGDEIILNIAEHHANLLPWQEVAKKTGAVIRYVTLTETGAIDLEVLQEMLSERTKIVSFAHVTNVLGSYNDPQKIAQIVRTYSHAYIVVDGAQGVTQYPVDVQASDCDFYAFSGHKLYGPTGVGILYGKRELLTIMQPKEFGGDMVDTVTKTTATYKDAPHKFEAGTMMIAEVLGLGEAITFFQQLDHVACKQHIKTLRAQAIAKLTENPKIILYNADNEDATTISFNVKNVHAHDAASVFSNYHVVLRAGHHCAQLLLERLATTASLRASLSFYNTERDVAMLVAAARKSGDFLDELF